MKFELKGPFDDNIYNLMRSIEYHFWGKDERSGELNFVHPLGGDAYPRFHIFLTIKNNSLIFDLHLDQRRTSYQGSAPHGGEYEGELVKKEAERVKEILSSPPSLPLGN